MLAYALVLAFPALAAEPPVIEAVRSSDMTRLRQLVREKDALLARGSENQTALHEAAAKCNLEAAKLLVSVGVDRSIYDNANRTAAMIATSCPLSAATNQLVRVMGAPLLPKVQDESAPWSLQDASARGHLAVVSMLMKMGADVNAVGNKGNRPLELACRNGRLQVTKALLDNGADVRLRTISGMTVLHEAALGGSAEVIQLLIDRGADINAVDAENGSTSLHYAASFGRVDAVRTLIRHGADVTRKNNKGMTALETAITNGQEDVIKILRK